MRRRVAKKVDGRVSREILAGEIRRELAVPGEPGGHAYRTSTLRASARKLVRDLKRQEPPDERLPYVRPTVTELGKLGVLFRGCD
jgi:hypothetical protein